MFLCLSYLYLLKYLKIFPLQYLIDNLSGTIASTNYGTLLLSDIEPTPYRSLYSGATLKPYIRRDGDSAPTWLKLTDELLRRTNRYTEFITLDYNINYLVNYFNNLDQKDTCNVNIKKTKYVCLFVHKYI